VSLRLDLPGVSLDVAVVRRPRKTIGIRVDAGRVEIVASPRVTLAALRALLDDKRDWIARHWQRQQAVLAEREACPVEVSLQGRTLPLLRVARQPPYAVLIDGCGVQIGGDAPDCRPQVAAFLQAEARRAFPVHFARLAPLAARAPQKLALSSARTRWGSCTAAGVIRLNWRLIQAPAPILDYVLAHELAHLRHMNHSPAFWAETARLCPEWRPARQWLKRQGETLFVFG
jgi:predicted metal-dependent hydrolase